MIAASMKNTMKNSMLQSKIKNGVVVCTPNNLRMMTPYILREQGDWFEREIDFVRLLVEPGMQMLDIGANYGVYTLAAAERMNAKGAIWSFEPCSETAYYLRESVAVNGFKNVKVIQKGLGRVEGWASLTTHENSEVNSVSKTETANSERIEITTLDSFLKGNSDLVLDFIKMDAEGMEDQILLGASLFFKNQQPTVMFEIKDSNKVNTHLFDAFHALGYELYKLIPGLNVLAPFKIEDKIDSFQLNLFAVHPSQKTSLMDRDLLVRGDVAELLFDHISSKLTAQEIAGALSLMPYAKNYETSWAVDSTLDTGMIDALGFYVYACMPNLEMNLRYASLSKAYQLMSELHQKTPTINTALSCVRLAMEVGQQNAANKFLRDIEVQTKRASTNTSPSC